MNLEHLHDNLGISILLSAAKILQSQAAQRHLYSFLIYLKVKIINA